MQNLWDLRSKTLNFLLNYPHPPKYIGFICNYEKSPRYIEIDKLKKLLEIDKKIQSLLLFWSNLIMKY